MHKFRIDSNIIDDFLNHQDIGKYYMDDIYMVGDEEEHSIFMMPLNPDYERIRFIKDKIINLLNNFYLSDEQKYHSFIKSPENIEEKIVVKIVVGMPNHITKLFRSISSDKIIIIIDLANYCFIMNDNSEIIEDVMDYLGYALTLMVLDASTCIDSTNSITLFEHAVYSTSFAGYISESNQLNFMRNLDQLNIWLFLEYDTIQKRYQKKKNAKRYVDEYLDIVFKTNPEMVALGVTGKIFLEDKTYEEAKQLFEAGPKQFLKQIYKQQDISFVSRLTKILSFLEAFLIPLLITWMITLGIYLITNRLEILFRVISLVSIFILTLRDSLKYKLMRISYGIYFLKVLMYLFSSILFLLLT